MLILGPNSWRPKLRKITYQPKPDWIPEWVYTSAVVAKKNYNEKWEFWVWQVSKDFNVSQSIAEDACIRGLKKELLQYQHVYGDTVGKWFVDYMDMGDIFRKVKHPTYLNQLVDPKTGKP